MRTFRTEAIIIKRRNFGEADKFLTVFTKELGKLQIKAPGIRKLTSRRSPHVELLNYSILSLYNGSVVPILTEAQTIETYGAIKEDLNKVGFAYHLCELIDGLCPEGQVHEDVFTLLKETLTKIAASGDIAIVVHGFEVSLLTALGYWKRGDVSAVNTRDYIEQLLERKLKSRSIFLRRTEK